MQQPTVSLVMPLYNGRPYVAAAIDSVLAQTFTDWELIVIDDGSTDGGMEVVQAYSDHRIRPMANSSNRGVAYTRGVGIKEARGKFLAWIDSDDVILPQRLSLQLDYLHANPEVGLCGTWIERFGGGDHSQARPPDHAELLRCLLLFTPIVPNATVMLRLPLVRHHRIRYDETLPIAEDYDFVLQCSRHFKLGIVPNVLYRYRVTEGSLMQRYDEAEDQSFETLRVVSGRALAHFGVYADERQLRSHRFLNSGRVFTDFRQYRRAFEWLLVLMRHNDATGYYDRTVFRRAVADRFYFISKKASFAGLRALTFYLRQARLHKLLYPQPLALAKLSARCFIRYDKF
ncbi:hypothetical protein LEM8419_00822 [Neolewinella maritima]|uniref:Glycosyltransferase 2-like domain-containing protein n=1 Tax=Neolewinella maritima TaxID=1383882 RepID=A0ABM9AXT9_9BACT|nr:glycosyltransferase family 2 protein [Neolewinella maritima]CAH0999522.1 hypothetical protein LEM8419_00822 [Neolewinella maritima]